MGDKVYQYPQHAESRLAEQILKSTSVASESIKIVCASSASDSVKSRTLRAAYLFIIESYTKYRIDWKIKTEKKQHIQPGYNPTHTLENRSTSEHDSRRHIIHVT